MAEFAGRKLSVTATALLQKGLQAFQVREIRAAAPSERKRALGDDFRTLAWDRIVAEIPQFSVPSVA